jgi:hypothetical protein
MSVTDGPFAVVSVHSGKVFEVAEGAVEVAVIVQPVDQG